MTAAEVAIVKALLHEVVDQELPALVQAEEAKLPAAYVPIVQAVSTALMPALVALIDAKIDAIQASA